MSKKHNSSLSHFADDFEFFFLIQNSNNNLKYITAAKQKKTRLKLLKSSFENSILRYFLGSFGIRISCSGMQTVTSFSRKKNTINYFWTLKYLSLSSEDIRGMTRPGTETNLFCQVFTFVKIVSSHDDNEDGVDQRLNDNSHAILFRDNENFTSLNSICKFQNI